MLRDIDELSALLKIIHYIKKLQNYPLLNIIHYVKRLQNYPLLNIIHYVKKLQNYPLLNVIYYLETLQIRTRDFNRLVNCVSHRLIIIFACKGDNFELQVWILVTLTFTILHQMSPAQIQILIPYPNLAITNSCLR